MGPLAFARRIAVFRALRLGDLLCAVPALRALRAAAPQAHIALIGLPWACEFAERYRSYVDEFIAFPGWPGLPEGALDLARLAPLLRQAQRRRFDLAIQMHGSGQLTNAVCRLLGAERCAGFSDGSGLLDPGLSIAWDPREHEVLRCLRLMERLGAPARGIGLEFPTTGRDRAERLALEARLDLAARPYACVHPGAQLPSRRWPAERFAEVGDGLAARGLRVLITGSGGEEAELASRVARAMSAPALNVAGMTSLGALALLVRDARLVVCNDTGVSHVAAALRTRSVVVACGSDPRRWAPLDQSRHRVLHHPVPCRPCAYRECPVGHPCARGLDAAAVLDAVAGQLDGESEQDEETNYETPAHPYLAHPRELPVLPHPGPP